MLAPPSADKTPEPLLSLDSFRFAPIPEISSRSALPAISPLATFVDSEVEVALEFWIRNRDQRLISDELYHAIAYADAQPRLPEDGLMPLSVGNLFYALSKISRGRELLSHCLNATMQFQFSDVNCLSVTQRSGLSGHLPLEVCNENAKNWKAFVADLSDLSKDGFTLWLAQALHSQESAGDESATATLANELRSIVQTRPLSLCTYNVWGTHGVLGLERLFGFGTKDPDRFQRIGRMLRSSDFDIVALQEMWDARTQQIIGESKYAYVAKSDEGTGMWQRPGLVTLSRFPIVETETLRFSLRGGHERYVHKGVLRARVQLPDGTLLDTYNSHLVSPEEKLPLIGNSERLHWLFGDPPVREIRLHQIGELAQFIARTKTRDPGVEYVVLCDGNSPENSPEYAAFVAKIGVDLFRARLPRYPNEDPAEAAQRLGITFDPTANPWILGRNERPGRLDYIFASWGLANSCAIEMALAFNISHTINSDHFGTAASILRTN